MDRIRIVKGTDEFILPERLVIVDDEFKVRSNPEDRVFAHGASDISDGKIQEKMLRIEGVVDHLGPQRAVFFSQMQLIRQKLYQSDYKLYLGDDYYINVSKALQIKDDYLEAGSNYNAAKLSIDLLCLDPFWYAATDGSGSQVITESPTTFMVENSGKAEAHPIITITAAETIADLILENTSDPQSDGTGLKFRYQDPAFVSGNVLVVDCKLGTVTRGETNTIRYFSGAFIKLLAGSNSLEYTGGDCSIALSWGERYF
jgi:phage-related protein